MKRIVLSALLLVACDSSSRDDLDAADGPADASVSDGPEEDASPVDGSPDATPDGAPDATPPDTAPPEGSWVVDVVDVGTGLAVFVRGHDFALIYDAGSNDDLRVGAENRVLAYLRATAPELATIDHVILSHPHRDHVELLPDVFAAYDVHNVWDPGAVNQICAYRALLAAVAVEPGVAYHTALSPPGEHAIAFEAMSCYGESLPAEAIPLVHAEQIVQGTRIVLGEEAALTFLHADGAAHGGRFNENSLVVRFELGGNVLLFMGDAEGGLRDTWPAGPLAGSVEDDLMACCATELRADVLIAGHHGSKTSSRTTFLDAVQPAITVISSGPRLYGSVQLPDVEVADELDRRGEVFRTDRRDSSCALDTAKIGPDNDGRPGGCDNIRVHLDTLAAPSAEYLDVAD